MPLKKGNTREAIHHNIRELMTHGHKYHQALAIALKKAAESKRK